MAKQNSIISYVPQPYFVAGGSCEVTVDTSYLLTNGDGALDPDLSNFMTVKSNGENTGITFDVDFDKLDSHLPNYNMTIGLIGCSVISYEVDTSGDQIPETINPDPFYAVMVETDVLDTPPVSMRSFSHGSQNSIATFCGEPLPGVLSGGSHNLIFSGLGAPKGNDNPGTLQFSVIRLGATGRHMDFVLGHVFIGVELPIIIDPRSFTWGIGVRNQRFLARDFGALNSEGVLVRQASFDVLKIANNDIVGSVVGSVSGPGDPENITAQANYFDMAKVNTSYPVVLNPYPAGPSATAFPTVDEYNLWARENFFSIYGFLQNDLEFGIGEFRDGLNSEFRAKFRIMETR